MLLATSTAPAVAGTIQNLSNSDPTAVWRAFRNQRNELSEQLDRLRGERHSVSEQLQNSELNAADQKGLEQRIASLDDRINSVEKQLAAADQAVAQSAAIPGAVVPDPLPQRIGPPEEVWVITVIFILCTFLPLSIAFARRIWKRTSTAITSLPQEMYDRFARVEQSLDAIAVEVERIGENQRYLTRLQTEQRAIGAGAAEPIPAQQRAREAQK